MNRDKVDQYRFGLFGRMVMGVAHEVDNYLSVILGFAELIQISGGGEKKTLDSVGKILNAGERINNIVRSFSYYVRHHAPAREPFSPADMVGECLVFSRYDLGRNNVTLVLPEAFEVEGKPYPIRDVMRPGNAFLARPMGARTQKVRRRMYTRSNCSLTSEGVLETIINHTHEAKADTSIWWQAEQVGELHVRLIRR
jgi:hypothetical protein